MKGLGKILTELRKGENLTQVALAELFHVDKSTIAKYETDKIEPSYEILLKYANYFKVTTDYLLGRED